MRPIAWTAAVAASVASCTVVNGLVVPESRDPQDAAPVVEGAVVDADDGCPHAVPPPPSPAADPPGDLDLFFVMKDIDFGGGKVGLDLDHACTCHPSAATCKSASSNPNCDELGGRDNVVGRLLTTIRDTAHFDIPARINALGSAGKGGLLLRLQGYSGGPDDPTVQVSFFPSRGVCTLPADDAGVSGPPGNPSADGGATQPTCTAPFYDERDKWSYDPTQLLDPKRMVSKLVATNAYVVGGVLVASIDGALPLAGLDLRLQAGVVMARIATNPFRLEDGVGAGRWKLEDAFQSIRKMKVSDSASPLCLDTAYQFLSQTTICGLADIMDVPTADNTSQTCNAVSVGMTFKGAPATLGAAIPIENEDNVCPEQTLGCR
ncbi:MAG: hypothetical protein U0235_08170 [Polyangiaceae bacterium]